MAAFVRGQDAPSSQLRFIIKDCTTDGKPDTDKMMNLENLSLGGIVNQYGLDQEGKIELWINVYTARERKAISAQRFSSWQMCTF